MVPAMKRPLWPAWAFCTLPLWACGGGESGPTYHQDVKPILAGRCENCHRSGGIAPFALDSYELAKNAAAAIKPAVVSRRMPPWSAGPADHGYKHDPSLSDAQIELVSRWVDEGSPEGDPEQPGAPLPPVGGGLARVDREIRMAEPYRPKTEPDDYHCFAIEWGAEEDSYVTGFNAMPGNPEIVHHIAVYLITPDILPEMQKWEDSEEGNGWTCFGGPMASGGANVPISLLSAWIPGYSGSTFPEGFGIKVPKGSFIVLQVHYNTLSGDTRPDQTTLQFSVEDTVARPLSYAPFLNAGWTLGTMDIPANQKDIEHRYVADPRGLLELFVDLDLSNGFEIHAVMFHMHKLGDSGRFSLLKPGQTAQTLLDIEAWDFDWQREYFFETPPRFENGDQLSVRCVFDNTAAKQPCFADGCQEPADTNWGEGSTEEMCVANMLISPL